MKRERSSEEESDTEPYESDEGEEEAPHEAPDINANQAPSRLHYLDYYNESNLINKTNFVMPPYETKYRKYGHPIMLQAYCYIEFKEAARYGNLEKIKAMVSSNEYIQAYLSDASVSQAENIKEFDVHAKHCSFMIMRGWSEADAKKQFELTLKNNVERDPFHPATIAAQEEKYNVLNFFLQHYPSFRTFIREVFAESYSKCLFYSSFLLVRKQPEDGIVFFIDALPAEINKLIIMHLLGDQRCWQSPQV